MKNPCQDKWDNLLNSQGEDRKKAFVEYILGIKDWKNKKNKTPNEVAYWICSAVRFDDLKDNENIDKIIELACDLEMPHGSKMHNKTPEELWGVIEDEISTIVKNKG